MEQKSKNVRFENISKEYITHDGKSLFKAVDNISLDINAGDFVTLLGPSGCGKTTTLRMIAGFEIPTSGEIYIGNKKINNVPPNNRDTAMVFQSYALFPHYSVFDNVAYGLRLNKSKVSNGNIKSKVEEVLSLVNLDGLESRSPNQLSGGQQQRVALARALVMEPEVLLFDEPLSNLDAKLRAYMRTEIRKIQRRLNLTSIYVTHDQVEAMSMSDKIIIMNKGRIEQVGTPQEIYQHPKTSFVADFIGRANIVEGTVRKIESETVNVDLFGNTLRIPAAAEKEYEIDQKVKLVIRPESISVGKKGQLDGVVTMSTYMGSRQEYSVSVNGYPLFIEEANPVGKEIFFDDEKVKLSVQEECIHII